MTRDGLPTIRRACLSRQASTLPLVDTEARARPSPAFSMQREILHAQGEPPRSLTHRKELSSRAKACAAFSSRPAKQNGRKPQSRDLSSGLGAALSRPSPAFPLPDAPCVGGFSKPKTEFIRPQITVHQSQITGARFATHRKTGIAVIHRKQRVGAISNRNTFRGTPASQRSPSRPSSPQFSCALFSQPASIRTGRWLIVSPRFSLLPRGHFWSILPAREPFWGLGQCTPSRSDNPFPTSLRTYARAVVLKILNGGKAKP